MSPIGRLFIILNLILSALFLGWASVHLAKSDEFKGKYDGETTAHEATKTELSAQISGLRTSLEEEQRAKEALRGDRDAEKVRADRNQSELAEAKRQNGQLAGDIAAIRETLGGYRDLNDSLTKAKDAAVEKAQEAERARDTAVDEKDAADVKSREAEEAMRQTEAKVAQLETDLTAAQQNSSQLDARLKTVIAQTGIGIDDIAAQKLIEGAVISANYSVKPGLVALNVGSQKEVEKGTVFQIYNGAQYKGEVRVQDVGSNVSSALIVRTVPGQTIGQGDRATTRL